MTELAWAAGFFDGEGTTGNARGRSRGHRGADIQMAISQTAEQPLQRFRDAVGEGKVYGPYLFPSMTAKNQRRPQWRYHVGGIAVRRVIRQLWPFLCDVKRRQAGEALDRYLEARARPRRADNYGR